MLKQLIIPHCLKNKEPVSDQSSESYLWPRIMFILLGAGIMAGFYLHAAYAGKIFHESIFARYFIVSLCGLGFFMTFLQKTQKCIGSMFSFIYYIISVYGYYLAFENRLEPSYALGVYIILAVVGISAETMRFLTAFFITGIGCAIATGVLVENPILDAKLYTGATLFLLLSVFYITSRRIQLTQELAKESERANEAARAKGDFLARMSHEIRTPLNGIIPVTQLIKDENLNETQLNYLKVIESSGELLMNVINDILDLAKIEKNQIKLEKRSVSLIEVFKHLKELNKPLANKKGLEFELQLETNHDYYLLDDTRLKQVINNLVSNAIKFTLNGKVKLSVIQKEFNENRDLITVTVTDTGIGIPDDKQEIIFDPFNQADSSTNRKFGGTGLGLSICRSLVELMGSELELKSPAFPEDSIAPGSEFTFTLSLERAEQSIDSTSEHESLTSTPGFGMSSLLVEDNPVNRMILKTLLQNTGIIVKEAENGRDALALCETNQFDIIFMDVEMPEMNGFEVTRHIRNSSGPNANAPIICVSAHVMDEEKSKARQVGMNYFLSKPFRAEDIYSLLTELSESKDP